MNNDYEDQENDNYDIIPDGSDLGFGMSSRSPPSKAIAEHLRKMVSDRMTPEFKLNEEFLRRDSSAHSRASKAGAFLAEAISAISSPNIESKLASVEKEPLRVFEIDPSSVRKNSLKH